MKQVTMESIQNRIADLESAGKIVGGLSLSSEFELACLRELVAVTEKRDAVVAENVALKSCAEFYNSGFSPVKGTFGLEWKPTEKLLEDCGNVASDALQTPATDAAIAALRAEGVEMFAKKCSEKSKQAISSDTRDNWWLCGEHADDFARQLRESKGEVSNG